MTGRKTRFTNKVVLVTGGAGGIGQVLVWFFALKGAKVVFCDINREQGLALEQKIVREGMEALFVRSDVTCPEDALVLVNMTVERYGRLDIAINNACGIVVEPDGSGTALHNTEDQGNARIFKWRRLFYNLM